MIREITRLLTKMYNNCNIQGHYVFYPELQFRGDLVANQTDTRHQIEKRDTVVRRYAGRKVCDGNNFWWHTRRRLAVIGVSSFRLTRTTLFSRGRQTFAMARWRLGRPILKRLARMRDCRRKWSDFYGSKGAVTPKRAADRTSSFQLNAHRLRSAINAMDGEIRCFMSQTAPLDVRRDT